MVVADDSSWQVIFGGGGGGLVFMSSQGKPSELIFVTLNFVIATQSRDAVLCDVINTCSRSHLISFVIIV